MDHAESEERPNKIPVGRPLFLAVRLAVDADLSLLMSGPTGIGKSESLMAFSKALGIELRVVNGAALEGPGDLTGLQLSLIHI